MSKEHNDEIIRILLRSVNTLLDAESTNLKNVLCGMGYNNTDIHLWISLPEFIFSLESDNKKEIFDIINIFSTELFENIESNVEITIKNDTIIALIILNTKDIIDNIMNHPTDNNNIMETTNSEIDNTKDTIDDLLRWINSNKLK